MAGDAHYVQWMVDVAAEGQCTVCHAYNSFSIGTPRHCCCRHERTTMAFHYEILTDQLQKKLPIDLSSKAARGRRSASTNRIAAGTRLDSANEGHCCERGRHGAKRPGTAGRVAKVEGPANPENRSADIGHGSTTKRHHSALQRVVNRESVEVD